MNYRYVLRKFFWNRNHYFCQRNWVNWVFVTKSSLLIALSLQPYAVDLRYFKLWILLDKKKMKFETYNLIHQWSIIHASNSRCKETFYLTQKKWLLKGMITQKNWLLKGTDYSKKLITQRNWLLKETDYSKELITQRNRSLKGTDYSKKLITQRNWLPKGTDYSKELITQRNWFLKGTDYSKKLITQRNWLPKGTDYSKNLITRLKIYYNFLIQIYISS